MQSRSYYFFFAGDFLAGFFFADFAAGFLTAFAIVASAVASVFFGDNRWASRDFTRAALFLWIICFFAALSSKLAAALTFFAVGDVTAFFTASFNTTSVLALARVLFLSCFNFFLADLITGIVLFYHVIL